MDALIAAARAAPHIEMVENARARALLRDGNGARARRRLRRRRRCSKAAETVLATGGVGGLYEVTTNPPEAHGPRPGHGGARRRADRRSRVRAVSSHRDRHRPRSRAARHRGAARRRRAHRQRRRAKRSSPISRRATWWRAPSMSSARPGAAPSSMRARRSARISRAAFPTVFAACMSAGIDPRAGADPGRAGGALSHGRHRHRHLGPHDARRPVGRGRMRLHRRAWRQPARLQFAARSGRVRAPHRRAAARSERARRSAVDMPAAAAARCPKRRARNCAR